MSNPRIAHHQATRLPPAGGRLPARRCRGHLARTVALGGAFGLALTGCASAEPDADGTATVTTTITEEPPDDGAEPTPTDDPAPTQGPAPTEDPDDEPVPDDEPAAGEAPFPADRSRDTAEPEGFGLLPVHLRFAAREGYDRIVLDLVGDGAPGWSGEYVDTPTEQGSGFEVDLAGEAFLEVSVSGVRYPTEDDEGRYGSPEDVHPRDSGVVREVRVGGVFEGYQQIFVGLASEEPFRIFRLEDPPRVVIDVQHP